jgi:peptide/nickel transport system substrate-binding protein
VRVAAGFGIVEPKKRPTDLVRCASVAIDGRQKGKHTMHRWHKLASAAILTWVMTVGGPGSAAAQTKPAQPAPEGEMRFALYVTIAPGWLDPGETVPGGTATPFWMAYALHDALVKPMPGNLMTPSLAESWSASEDGLSYDFVLRKGLKFHNGDPFTAEDVVFSFKRAKGAQLHEKVKEVVIVGPHHVRFVLHEPWPDFMAFYGTLASAAGWIVPKNYVEKVGPDGFKKHPIGLGPYKFVSMKPGVELVMEANEDYWRKVPSVKRIVYQSVPEATTRLAMLTRGEVDVAYLLEGQLGESIKNDPKLKLAFSGGVGTYYLDFFDMWDPKSPWADQRVRKAASLAIDRQALSDADTLGASKINGNVVLKRFEYALPIEADPYDPVQAKKLLAEAGYPNGFDAGELYPWPPYFATGEAIIGYLGAVGIKLRLRTMERAAFFAAYGTKKLKGVCMCIAASYGNASTRLAAIAPSTGNFAYGGWPDIDEQYKQQLTETDPKKREAMLHQIQKTLHERVRFAPIFDYFWPSGIGPRVEEAALMSIDPYPWSAPMEDLRLKKP